MADRFVQFFSSIPDRDDRLQTLHQLVQSLGFDERQAACAFIQSKNDIVPRLPLELMLEIFSYLRLEDTWTLQLVNRQWRRTLSSERFLRATLARWDTHDPSDSARSRDTVAVEPLDEKLRRMHAMRDGKPSTLTTFDNTGTSYQKLKSRLCHRHLDLQGDKIAYTSSQPGEGDSVVLRNLVTGTASVLHGEARERITGIVLTTEVIAFLTFAACLYITKVGDHQFLRPTSRIKLPSSHTRAMGGHEGTLAIAMAGGFTGSTSVTSILLYDVGSRKLQDLSVAAAQKELESKTERIISHGIIVDSSKQTIDIFTLACTDNGPSQVAPPIERVVILHLRISFLGAVIGSSTWEPEGGSSPHTGELRFRWAPSLRGQDVHLTMVPPQPTGYRSEYRISIGWLSPTGSLPAHLVADVVFNTRDCVFQARDSLRKMCWVPSGTTRVELIEAISDIMHADWKGITMRQYLSETWRESTSMMNDTFFVSLEHRGEDDQKTRIRVLCFDEKVAMYASREFGQWG